MQTIWMSAMEKLSMRPLMARSTHSAMLPQSGHRMLAMTQEEAADRKASRKPFGYISVCSEISSASSTSIPRYRTVLSNRVWPSNSCPRKLWVRR